MRLLIGFITKWTLIREDNIDRKIQRGFLFFKLFAFAISRAITELNYGAGLIIFSPLSDRLYDWRRLLGARIFLPEDHSGQNCEEIWNHLIIRRGKNERKNDLQTMRIFCGWWDFALHKFSDMNEKLKQSHLYSPVIT